MFKRIDHVEILASNMDRTIDFYQNALTFRVKDRRKVQAPTIDEVAFMTLGDTTIELLHISGTPGKFADPSNQPCYRAIAIEVSDMDKAIAHLRSKGVTIAREPYPMGNGKRAEIKDPDGLGLELRQW